MLPRQRAWEPAHLGQFSVDSVTLAKSRRTTKAHFDSYISFLDTIVPEDPMPKDLLEELLNESQQEDFDQSQYDPYQGNLCAVGSYLGLPVFATPSGPTGASLELLLVRTRGFTTIITPPSTFPSAVSRVEPEFVKIYDQVPSRLPSLWKDEIIHAAISPHVPNQYALLGDKGSLAIWTAQGSGRPADEDNAEIDGMDSGDHIGGIKRQENRRNVTKTISGVKAMSNSSNTLDIRLARHASVADSDQPLDPWRSCRWDAHPTQIVVATRKDVSLVDMRKKDGHRCLYDALLKETVEAIQEDYSAAAPFQTYIATSHQVACIDHRFTKRPLLSWAHHLGREKPSGIKCMDMDYGTEKYGTVVMWTKRNAEIIAYNVSRGSSQDQQQPLQLMGRPQEIPSFHSHAQYTNSSTLRDATRRYDYLTDTKGRLGQGVKPPLLGLDLLSSAVFDLDDLEDDDNYGRHQRLRNCKTWSVLQYSATGAVYAQELELLKHSELSSGQHSHVSQESILSADFHADLQDESVMTTIADGNPLSSELTHNLNKLHQGMDPNEIVEKIINSTEGLRAPWKSGVKDAQDIADKPNVTHHEIRRHDDVDLNSFLSRLWEFLQAGRRSDSELNRSEIESKVSEAIEFVTDNSQTTITMLELLEAIECDGLSCQDRESISQGILQYIDGTPSEGNRVVELSVTHASLKTHPVLGDLLGDDEPSQEKIEEILRDLYPLPPARTLDEQTIPESPDSIAADLANLSIPGTRPTARNNLDDSHSQTEQGSQVWPSKAVEKSRYSIIHKLSQDLILSTFVVVKKIRLEAETTARPEISSEQIPSNTFMFQYLSQFPGSDRTIKVPTTLASILDEWPTTFEDPSNYVYKPPAGSFEDADKDSDAEMEDEEEARREQQEYLLKLRKRREQKLLKTMNISVRGSASQPAMFTESTLSSISQLPDEDGMYSLPTVISASQPAVISSAMRSKPKPKPKPKPQPVNDTRSQPQPQPREESTLRFNTQTPLFKEDSLFTASFASNSQDWENNLSLSQEQELYSQGPVFFGASDSVGVSSSVGMSFSEHKKKSHSKTEDSEGHATTSFWASASQPVPGPFANRVTKKKKKVRAQGF
ncbi:hypothetical protein BGZ94_008868 [Podila epigama]|nr:hypothetical protein BGZ94_008868 [Podila epigama]